MFMLWDGNRQIQEYAESHVFTTVYEQDSFVPVARLVSSYADNAEMKVYHYHTDHLGTPNELTDDKGKVVWLADYYAWGERVNSEALLRTSARRELCSSEVSDISCSHHYKTQCIGDVAITADELQPIRFQGQFFDGETGLHYNRFRYYDGDVGMFISRDPIGLMGGMNNFQYAPNPVGWIDPLGLWKFPWESSTGTDAILFDNTTDANFIKINNTIPSLPNTFQIDGHGNSQYIRDVVDGKKVDDEVGKINSAERFNKRFESNSEWQLAKKSDRYTVVLYACTTGNSTHNKMSLAQKISVAYPNLIVTAPTRQTWWGSTGLTGVYPKNSSKEKDFENPGYWMTYQRGKAVTAHDATWEPGKKGHIVPVSSVPKDHFEGDIGEKK